MQAIAAHSDKTAADFERMAFLERDPALQSAAFRAARRHTRFVRFLKYALPLSGTLLLFGFLFLAGTFSFKVGDIAIGALKFSGSSLTMEQPKLEGVDKRGNAYSIRAYRAVQDLATPHILTLQKVNANLTSKKAGKIIIVAPEGVYDTKTEKLTIDKGLTVETAEGYVMRLKNALIDVQKGDLNSPDPVKIDGPSGSLRAKTFTVKEQGKRIFFRGGVKMVVIRPPETRRSATPKPAGQ